RLRSSLSCKRDSCEWSDKETIQLIASVRNQLNQRDFLSYSKRLKMLNWKKITVPSKSITECKRHLELIMKNVHKFRTLGEILSEVEKNLKEMETFHTECSVTKEIVHSNDEIIVETINCSANGEQKLKNSSLGSAEKTPEKLSYCTPFIFFAKSVNSNDVTDAAALRDRYDFLSDDAKLFWIQKSISYAEHTNVNNILTSAEQNLLKTNDNIKRNTNETVRMEKKNPFETLNLKRKCKEDDAGSDVGMRKKLKCEGNVGFEQNGDENVNDENIVPETNKNQDKNTSIEAETTANDMPCNRQILMETAEVSCQPERKPKIENIKNEFINTRGSFVGWCCRVVNWITKN
ncbi:hypothetical protein Bhyg_08266, partial [Pseudolycoriella hygida]